MKVALIGGVTSTLVALEKLHEHGFAEVEVFAFHPADARNVSGWRDLAGPAAKCGYRHRPFVRVNDCMADIREFGPDMLLVVGLSQLLSSEILELAPLGGVGFHPTALPRGRGRAPIAWMALRCEDGAATFFRLQAGTDDGPVIVQMPFEVRETDDASSIEAKLLDAEARALDQWLPTLRSSGHLSGQEQDHASASYYGRRTWEDGLVDWAATAQSIDRLIKASCSPHPGAFTFEDDQLVRLWRSRVASDARHVGVTGRILHVDGGAFMVQCGDGPLMIEHWTAEVPWKPRVGMKLGYRAELEIQRLRIVTADLSSRIRKLEETIDRMAGSASSARDHT